MLLSITENQIIEISKEVSKKFLFQPMGTYYKVINLKSKASSFDSGSLVGYDADCLIEMLIKKLSGVCLKAFANQSYSDSVLNNSYFLEIKRKVTNMLLGVNIR